MSAARIAFAFCLALVAACRADPPSPKPAALASAPPSPPSTRFALVHATVIDVKNGVALPDHAVVVDGDRIVAVARGDAPAGRTIDARGKYVIPGLWDMHVHLADPESAKLFIANGVTGVRVMWGNPPFSPGMDRFHFNLRDAFEKKTEIGPRMVIASQILDGPRPIWPNSVSLSTPDDGRKAVDDATKSGVDFVKVYSLLPRDVYFAIADESRKQGLPFAGHVPEAVSVAEASDAGQKSVEHLTGMLVACSAHEDALRKQQGEFAKQRHGDAEWSRFRGEQLRDAIASYDDARARTLFAKLIARGTWQCPTLIEEHNTAWQDDPSLEKDPRIQYVAPFARKTWQPKERPAGEYAFMRALFEKKLALVGAMSKAGVPLLAGTDEFNPYCFAGFGLHDELEWLVKAGLTPAEALRAATSSPAKFLGWESRMGAVAEGNVADLVVLDADSLADIASTRRVSSVVLRGTLYERPALEKMLEEAKYAAAHSRW